MKIFIPSIIDSFQFLKVPFSKSYYVQKDYEKTIPDIDLTEQNSFYLVRQRVENLREKIDKTLDEIVELKTLEEEYQQEFTNLQFIPENLGVPSKTDTFISALEAKRVNRNDNNYDGEIDDNLYSSINQYYIDIFSKGWLNNKSFRFLDQHKQVITSNENEISIFDVFDKKDIGLVFQRCNDLATSPLYEKMQEPSEDHYLLLYGIECTFKNKCANFLVPIQQFSDIPKVALYLPSYISFSMILPHVAHEKKRYFKKGGICNEFIKYLERLEVPISSIQKEYLEKLNEQGILRIYQESLENTKQKMIRAYFLNITKIPPKEKYQLQEKLLKFCQTSDQINVSRVLPDKPLPTWIKKIDGIIIEHISGDFIKFNKPQKISVDPQLNSTIHQEYLFLPSKKLQASSLQNNEWKETFTAELRERYRKNALRFQKYARLVAKGKVELACTCPNPNHQERCTIPILEKIFDLLTNSK